MTTHFQKFIRVLPIRGVGEVRHVQSELDEGGLVRGHPDPHGEHRRRDNLVSVMRTVVKFGTSVVTKK